MEVHVPIQVPDSIIRKLVVNEFEGLFVAFNEAHAKCANGEPTKYFSEDVEEEMELLEVAIKGLDLAHGFLLIEAQQEVARKLTGIG